MATRIISNIEQVADHVTNNLTSDFDVIKTYIDQAELDYIKPILGSMLIETLEVYIDSGQEGSAPTMDKLLIYTRRAMANFAYYIAIPMLDVIATDAGFAIVSSQNQSPASKSRVENLRNGVRDFGYRALETLLEYLEDNESSFNEWTTSEAYQSQTEFFINSAKEFQKFVDINTSRLKYIILRPLIRDAEMMFIESAISKDLADTLKDHIENNNLTPAEKIIVPKIKAALAMYVSAQDKELFEKNPLSNMKATKYIASVVNIMIADIDNYPDYRDSDLYDDSETFSNQAEDSCFYFG